MRILRQVIYGLFAAAMVAGCTSDLPGDDPNKLPEDDGSGFFMALDIQMPGGITGSRSQTDDPDANGTTSTDGVEVGTTAENTVTTALIVLAAKEAKTVGSINYAQYGLIATGMVENNRISALSDANSKQYRATARLQKSNLEEFYRLYGSKPAGHEVYVFVFCNPTADLITSLNQTKKGSDTWMDDITEVYQNNPNHTTNQNIGIWGTNSFLMNNVSLTTRLLPANLDYWENCNSVDNAFHLSQANGNGGVDNSGTTEGTVGGPVKVERSVARFDFKDGSGNDNTYNVLTFGPNDNEQYPVVAMQLQKMCLVNMSTKFYSLLRVSDDGTPTGANFKYCAPELPWTHADGMDTGGNYVVGPNYQNFVTPVQISSYYKYFNFPFFASNDEGSDDELISFDNGNWDVVKISDVLDGQLDNYNNEHNYHIWRYVTENVIPGGPENQVNAISTGVVFKGRLKGLYDKNTNYGEAYWNQGYLENLANCLNDGSFTYEGQPNQKLTGDSNTDPIIYYYDGHLYMGWRHIRQAAIQASVTYNTAHHVEINRSNSLYKAVFGNGPIPPTYEFNGSTINTVYMTSATESTELVDPMWDENKAAYANSADYAWQTWYLADKPDENDPDKAKVKLLNEMRLAITDAGITIYQSSNDKDFGNGYYCYYYYWNRHNDNGIPGTMGPMEFAVVRNNVYKLSVTNISRLGHPRIPANDPDNPNPDTPDESDRIYLDVEVAIVPWVVRLNNIVF